MLAFFATFPATDGHYFGVDTMTTKELLAVTFITVALITLKIWSMAL
jgi:hypothetical protein